MSLPVHIASSQSKFAVSALLFLSLLAGCANPGPPHPPSLHLPKVVADLSAERIGDEVKLQWSTPDLTTDELHITGPITAQICRSTVSAHGTSAPPCSPVQSMLVKSGPSESTDLLPAALTTGPQTLIAYRITLLNNRKRSAGPSSPAFAAAGPAPPAITGLHIQAAEQGAMLQWDRKDGDDRIELDRRLSSSPGAGSSTQPERLIGQPATKESAEMHLRVPKADARSLHADAGGSLDATARPEETYTYTAQRIRSVVFDGHKLEIRSTLSPAITVTMHDSFPPKPPVGLEAVASESTAAAAIDLSWRPNTEPDLAGYLMYRQEFEAGRAIGSPVRLTPTPVTEPGFHDTSVVAGHTYSYSITAVDTSGNESAPSAAAQEEVRQP